MDYPFWNPGTSYAFLMAGIAILHVFISQFAIGGGLYPVVTEHRMRKRGDAGGLEYLERLTRVFDLALGIVAWMARAFFSSSESKANVKAKAV